jgi:hypothetical protein
MVEKCANPECSEAFDHLQGRLYCCPMQMLNGKSPANSHGVEHHWLCGLCSKTYTFKCQAGLGVVLTPRVTASPKGQHRLEGRPLRAA